jgi:hypothetical protein
MLTEVQPLEMFGHHIGRLRIKDFLIRTDSTCTRGAIHSADASWPLTCLLLYVFLQTCVDATMTLVLSLGKSERLPLTAPI